MKNFNWDERVAVHCNTVEKANDFLMEANKRGFKWIKYGKEESLLKNNYWYCYYEEETCYLLNGTIRPVVISSYSLYKKNNYKIIEWEIDNVKEFTEEDLKVGMLVETRRGEKAIIMPEHDYLVASYANGNIADIDFANDSFSIIKVWSESSSLNFLTLHRTLLWERKEVEEMTLDAVCKELGREIKIVK